MRFPISFALGLAAASVPGAAFAQGAHSDHEHGGAAAAAAPTPESPPPMAAAMQNHQEGRSGMAMSGHGADCHCCCCEMMRGMMGQHGPAADGPAAGHADHDQHRPPSQ